jgi:CBS domain-containing protein
MLNGVAGRDIEFHRLKASERMSSPVNTISPEASILEAGRIMDTNCIRRVPVVQDGQLVGIVTETDITRGLISLSPLRYISDIMTKQVASVEAEVTADVAARVMSSRNISCLIVMHRQEPAGIVTEKDFLKRIVALHKNPVQTLVADVMSFPVVMVPPTCSLLSAIKRMETMHLHRLLVAEGKTVCGIVTQTDIMQAIRSTIEAVESQRRAWAAELADLVQHISRDTARVREFLDNIENEADRHRQTADAALAAEQVGHGVFIL